MDQTVNEKGNSLIAEDGRGYIFAICDEEDASYVKNALHVEWDGDNPIYGDDAEAARAAERDGVKLIYGMKGVEDGVYLDYPENRCILEKARARELKAPLLKKIKNVRHR